MDCRKAREEAEKTVGEHFALVQGRDEGDVEDSGDGSGVCKAFRQTLVSYRL